jgi:hypothetical protein
MIGILIGGWAMSDGKIDITAKGPDGLPGIFWMIKQEDMSAIAAWLDAGGDIEARGYHGASPALAAAVIDNWPAVLRFLERGARADIADGRGYTLGFLASRSRAAPEGRYGQALAQVRAILADRGLLSRIYQPATVKRMKAEGRWPPAEYR